MSNKFEFQETSANIVIWILPLIHGKLKIMDLSGLWKLKEVGSFLFPLQIIGMYCYLLLNWSVGRIVLSVSILNNMVDSCEYGAYSWFHNCWMWLVGLYYDAPHYSVW